MIPARRRLVRLQLEQRLQLAREPAREPQRGVQRGDADAGGTWHGDRLVFDVAVEVGDVARCEVAQRVVVGAAQDLGEFTQLSAMPLEHGMAETARITIKDALILAIAFLLIVSIDVPYQLWRYYKGLRMNLEELKRESKESDGDPHLKGKIKSMQREAARRRMMASVPNADVIVTNPTHYSVALKYDKDGKGAPRVVAKGIGPLALKIREVAQENKVPLVEAPPLARALYSNVELEQEIPGALYTAVAKLLAYVYALAEGKGHMVEVPGEADIPKGMDPGPAA